MKKIVLGFIALGLLTLAGCEKDDDTEMETKDITQNNTEDSNEAVTTNNTETNTDVSDEDESTTDIDTNSVDETTDTTNFTSLIQYGEGATDIDGNNYESVIIGNQEWMAENLRTTEYSDGTSITNVTDDDWYSLSSGAWCNYNNDNQYDTIYGKLYNWYAVETGLLCPTGWHVPTNAEWNVLEDYLISNEHWETGTVLKSNFGWDDREEGANGNGTDDYGWLGLPGGSRSFFAGGFDLVGEEGFWWSSDESSTYYAWLRSLNPYPDLFFSNNGEKKKGFSVRCLKD
tara:strand:+ start:1141 stop:2001 length:861 start_codon:yes stop_codon:yes gene_type:complete